MAHDKTAPAAQWATPTPRGVSLNRFALALDPETGHLVPVAGSGPLTVREDTETGHLSASDEDDRPAAKTAITIDQMIIY